MIWTLTFEAYFYLLLPFVSRFFCGSAAKVARNACIAALVTIGWAWIRFNVDGISRRLFGIALVAHKSTLARDRIQELMANLLPTYAVHFALGMAGAYAFLRLRGHLRLTQSRWFRVGTSVAQVIGIVTIVALMRWTAGLRLRDGTIATPAFWYFGRDDARLDLASRSPCWDAVTPVRYCRDRTGVIRALRTVVHMSMTITPELRAAIDSSVSAQEHNNSGMYSLSSPRARWYCG
ncbi:MAG TPA: hypothetical protein VIC60_11385 [Thermomicrobiales bacterium]